MSNFELKNITLNPQRPRPSIDVVFIAGGDASLISICKCFARDFDFYFLSIPTYLNSLLNSGWPCGELDGDKRQRALGLLHRAAFDDMIKSQQQVPALFLIPILHHKIDEEVHNGHRRFLIEGFGYDIETWTKFEEMIAVPSAILSFSHGNNELFGGDSEQRLLIEKFYEPITLAIERAGEEYETYSNLLAAIVKRAWDGKGMTADWVHS